MRSELRLNQNGEIFLEGRSYLSLKKAAELSTYHSDYLGRLVRNEKLRGQRFGIQWFIEKDSLLAFIGARRDSNEIDENTPKEADFTVKVEPSTISPLTIQDFLPKLVKKDSPLWESTLLGDLPAEAYPSGRRALAKAGESFSEAELPLGSSASPFAKQTFNFSIKRFLVPALAAFLLFSFGLFGESLALAGKSFVKNSGRALESLAADVKNISLSALFSPALPEFPQLSFPAGYSQALSFSFLTAPVSSFFSKISSFFRDAQDAFLTLLGVPGLEEELAVLPEPRLAGPTPPSPTLGVEEQQTPGVGGLQTPGVGLESELASLRRELNQLKSSGLSISSQLAAPSGAPIALAAIDEKLQLANNAVLAQVASSLASIESRIQPVQPNPVAFFTIPNKTPEKTFSGISSGFGSFDAGLEVSGNFNAYGKVALGTNGKSVSITSSTWNITSAGAASGFDSLAANDISAGTLTISSATLSGGSLSFSGAATTTIPSSLINAFSFATSTTAVPFLSFDTQNYRIGIGTTTPSETFSVNGNGIFSGSLNVGGFLIANSSSFSVSATTTASNQLAATAAPASPHTFGTWAIDTAGSNVTNSSLLVNPASSVADGNLFGIAVAGGVKFLVDAEGDVFANGLTTIGGTTLASTTASTFTVENSFIMGDAANNDAHIIRGRISHFATTTDAAYAMWNSDSSGDLLRLQDGAASPTTRFVFSAGGQAAFGTTTHSGLSVLPVGATSTTAIPLTIKGVTSQSADLFRVLSSSDSSLFNVTGSGSVGVWTTHPSNLFSVQGNALFSGNLSLANLTATGTVNFTGTGATTTISGGLVTGNNAALVVNQAATANSLYITNAGNVGIGTAAPKTLLHIKEGAGTGLTPDSSTWLFIDSGTNSDITLGSPNGNLGRILFADPQNNAIGIISYNHALDAMTFTVNNATRLSIDAAGNVGIGTTSPATTLSVAGNTYLDSNLITYSSSTAANLTVSYQRAATTTIPINTVYAWSIATSTTASPLFTFNTNGPYATTSINGGFVLNNGAVNYDSSSGIISADSIQTGPMGFDTDAGIVSWIDMPSSTTTANIVNSYSAMLDSTAILTIYGTTTTSGNITYGHVGIGTTSPTIARLSVQGNIAAFGCIRSATSTYSIGPASCVDIAETYPISEDPSAGDIMMVGPDGKLKKATDRAGLIGVVSSEPAILLEGPVAFFGSQINNQTLEHKTGSMAPIALAGRVPVKVSAEGGPIKPGDRITISSAPGVGMKATTSGQTVGIVLEPYDSGEIGKIIVFINLGYSKLDSGLSQALDGNGGLIVDQASGKMKSSYTFDMDNNDIINARKILSASGLWSIDENGKLIVQEIETKKLTVTGQQGITIYDRVTGQPVCVYSENGVLKSEDGECWAAETGGKTTEVSAEGGSASGGGGLVSGTDPPTI